MLSLPLWICQASDERARDLMTRPWKGEVRASGSWCSPCFVENLRRPYPVEVVQIECILDPTMRGLFAKPSKYAAHCIFERSCKKPRMNLFGAKDAREGSGTTSAAWVHAVLCALLLLGVYGLCRPADRLPA